MSKPYHVLIAPAAHRHIHALTPKNQKAAVKLLESLAINPRPPVSRKIDGMTGLYCEDVSQMRIVYKIEEQEILVLLVKHL